MRLCVKTISASLLTVFSLSCEVSAACLGDQNATSVYVVAIVPQLPTAVTYANWSPLLERVGLNSKQCFDLVVPETIPLFEQLLFKGTPDFAFVNPYHEVIAKKRNGYIPLLIDGSAKLTGILVVRSSSSIKSVQELQGKEIAFPAPNAFAASLLMRAELNKIGIQIKPTYLKTHASGYRAVAMGELEAAGGVNNTLKREEKSLRDSLRVLYETSPYAPHPFVANPRVPVSVRNEITASFISLTSSESGLKILENVQMPSPIRADYQRDFSPLERLNCKRLGKSPRL